MNVYLRFDFETTEQVYMFLRWLNKILPKEYYDDNYNFYVFNHDNRLTDQGHYEHGVLNA